MSKDYDSPENTNYSMKNNFQARNVAEMNKAYGYNDTSDLANTDKTPQTMHGAKRSTQPGADMPKTNKY